MDPKIKDTLQEINFLSEAVTKLHGLRNFPPHYEHKFQYEFLHNNISNTRLTLLLGLLLFVGSTIFDFTFISDTNSIFVRLYVISPILLGIYLLSLKHAAIQYQQILISAFALITMLGLVFISAVIPEDMRQVLYSSLILIALFVITISKLSFKYTIIVAACLLIAFNIGFLLTPSHVDKNYFWEFFGNNYIFLGAGILIAVASYVNELNLRKQFLLTTLITRKNELSTYLSNYDFVTGIANRRYFDNWLDTAWQCSMEYHIPLALLFIDFDNFKEYNDLYGHVLGDHTLREVAQRLEQCIEDKDLLARYGGDEFVVVLHDTSKESAIETGHCMLRAVEEMNIPHARSTISNYVTITIGVAILEPNRVHKIQDLIHSADLALQVGKKTMRNNMYLHEAEHIQNISKQEAVTTDRENA